MELPQDFMERMKMQLGNEFDDYLKSYEEKSVQGLRVNTAKISVEEFRKLAPFHLEKIPWTENGFYTDDKDDITKHPYYFAGLYYVQEPSAMLPAALLGAKPGERILDLCAAPGGKATELGGRLCREGVLVANDISHSRAKALLKNIELNGIGNVFVCSEEPEKLAAVYEGFFDRVLVDAPCSGEGMFRREPSMIKSYLEHGPQYYAQIQKKIVDSAVKMLGAGGKMVYSTCTFDVREDEEIVHYICENHADMEIVDIQRIYPHRVKGEGHFAAVLQKRADAEAKTASNAFVSHERACADMQAWEQFCRETLSVRMHNRTLTEIEGRLYALPCQCTVRKKIRYLRTGLFLGEQKQKRFIPSQALAMYLKQDEVKSVLSLECSDERVRRYLKGETLSLTEQEEESLHGWTLVCVDGYPLGWGKCTGGMLKNKYYTGWRMM